MKKEGELIENEHLYQVDGEIGRFSFTTHTVISNGSVVIDTSKHVFTSLNGKELYRTIGFKEIAIVHGTTENSYRKTSEFINRIRHQKEATPSRTLRDNTELEGRQINAYIESKSSNILQENGFNHEGVHPNPAVFLPKEPPPLQCGSQIVQAVEECVKDSGLSCEASELLSNPVQYEDPDHCVSMSIDDVSVKRQKETRDYPRKTETSDRKSLHNTIMHVNKGKNSYVLNSRNTSDCLRTLLAFLIYNDILDQKLIFFTDGHRSLVATVINYFEWHTYIQVILDWYHLEKKCKEQLSMAMNNRHDRNESVSRIKHLLWYGLVDRAIEYVKSIDSNKVKNEEARNKLIEYLDRNRSIIPCYSARNKLGLRNSSNIGEKMNDLIVSDRQKHNGRSWSRSGSLALTSVTAMVRNGESNRWFESGDLEFKFAA